MKFFHVLFPRFLPAAARIRREIVFAELNLAEAIENGFRCDIRDARANLDKLWARLALEAVATPRFQEVPRERERDVA